MSHTQPLKKGGEPKATLWMVNIDSADPARLARFYAAALGWEVTYSDDNYGMVEGDGIKIGFGKIEEFRPAQWPDEAGAKRFHLDLQVDDLDEAAESLCAIGASEPDFQPGAGRWRVLLDPDGQPFCLISAPTPPSSTRSSRRPATAPSRRSVSDLAELLVQNAEAWHAWLESHHAEHPGVWLVLKKKGGQATALTYAQALDEALCFGWIDGQIARRDDDSYRQRFTPRRTNSLWSARNVEHVARLTQAGRMRPAGIAAVDAAKEQGRWEVAYRGQADMQNPPDLAQALAANPAAAATFDQLDAANRYSIVYRLNAVKRPTTRDRKLAEYVDMLARGESLHPRKPRR